jgi:hypothetical protein
MIVENEIWKNVVGFEGLYMVSNFGRIKNLPKQINNGNSIYLSKEKIKKETINKQGYSTITLTKNNKGKRFLLHRLIAESFIPNIEKKRVVNHIDNNPKNNKVSNLEWVTHRENTCHQIKKQNCSSIYIGVTLHKKRNKWGASIVINKKNINLGRYNTQEDAYLARVNYEKENKIQNKYL